MRRTGQHSSLAQHRLSHLVRSTQPEDEEAQVLAFAFALLLAVGPGSASGSPPSRCNANAVSKVMTASLNQRRGKPASSTPGASRASATLSKRRRNAWNSCSLKLVESKLETLSPSESGGCLAAALGAAAEALAVGLGAALGAAAGTGAPATPVLRVGRATEAPCAEALGAAAAAFVEGLGAAFGAAAGTEAPASTVLRVDKANEARRAATNPVALTGRLGAPSGTAAPRERDRPRLPLMQLRKWTRVCGSGEAWANDWVGWVRRTTTTEPKCLRRSGWWRKVEEVRE